MLLSLPPRQRPAAPQSTNHLQPPLPPISDADADADSVSGVHGGRGGWQHDELDDDDDEDEDAWAGSRAPEFDEHDDDFSAGGRDFALFPPVGTGGRTAPTGTSSGSGRQPSSDPKGTEMQPPGKPGSSSSSSAPPSQPRGTVLPPAGYHPMTDPSFGLGLDDEDDDDDDVLSGSIGGGLIDEAEQARRVELVMSMGFDLTEAEVRAKLRDAYWDIEIATAALLM